MSKRKKFECAKAEEDHSGMAEKKIV